MKIRQFGIIILYERPAADEFWQEITYLVLQSLYNEQRKIINPEDLCQCVAVGRLNAVLYVAYFSFIRSKSELDNGSVKWVKLADYANFSINTYSCIGVMPALNYLLV